MLLAVRYSNKTEVASISNLPWMKAAVLNLYDKMQHAVGTGSNQCKTSAALNLLVKNFRKYYYRLIFTTGPKPIFTAGP